MNKFGLFIGLATFAMALFGPMVPSAEALALPSTGGALGPFFGGSVVFMFPCLNGGIFTVIRPAVGSSPGPFTWTPGTITKMAGPPHVIGGEVLGISGPPQTYPCYFAPCFGCFVLSAPMILLGTSAAPRGI